MNEHLQTQQVHLPTGEHSSVELNEHPERPQFVSGDVLTPEAIAMRIRAEQLGMQGAARGLGQLFSRTK